MDDYNSICAEYSNVCLCTKYLPVGYNKSTKLAKITLKDPKDVRSARDDVKRIVNTVYETDILFKNRYLIDHGLGGMSWTEDGKTPLNIVKDVELRYMAIDIEVLPPKTGGMPVPERDPIIMISLAFSPSFDDQQSLVLYNDSEKDLLNSFVDVFKFYNPDVICYYNGDNFDIPYIIKRCKNYQIRLNLGKDGSTLYSRGFRESNETICTGRICVDVLNLCRKNYSLRDYKLSTVAALVNETKGDVNHKEIRELWNNKDERLIKYAEKDALITLKLLRELRLIDKYIALSRASGALLQDVINSGQTTMIDALLMREYFKDNRVMPAKPIHDGSESDENNYEGAIVIEPPKGLSEDVIILDFQSLYPSIVMAYNVSYDTLTDNESVECNVSPTGARFVKSEIREGILPKVLKRLFNERLAAKAAMKSSDNELDKAYYDAKQYAMKILLNSFYGYAGYTKGRLFTIEVAESVTAYGRENLLATKAFIEESFGYEVIAGDTDSLFIKVGQCGLELDQYKKIGDEIAAKVSERLPHPMKLMFEAYAKRILFVAKKHYSMLKYEPNGATWKQTIKTKGLETVRRDWCKLTSDTLEKVLDSVLVRGDVGEAIQLCKSSISDVLCDTFDIHDIQLSRRYRGDGNGKVLTPHDNVARKCKERGTKMFQEGDRVDFIIIKGGSSDVFSDQRITSELLADRAEDPDYVRENNLEIDKDYYINNQIIPPVLRLLEPFGVTRDHLLGKVEYVGPKTIYAQKSIFNW